MRSCWGLGRMAALACLLAPVSGATGQQTVAGPNVVRMKVRENGRMLIPVAVNGKKELSFLFDTGATTTVVSERIAARAGIISQNVKPVITFAGPVSLPVGKVETLLIGGHSVADLEVVIADLRRLFNLRDEIDGILGQDVLSGFNYLLDRRQSRLQIDEAGLLSADFSGTRIVCQKRGGKMLVPAAGGTVRLILDSGNPYLVIYQDAASNVQPSVNANETKFVASSIGKRPIRPFRIDSLEIGKTQLHNLDAYLATRAAGRTEDGFLPVEIFDSIYVNNLESFVILNPETPATKKGKGR